MRPGREIDARVAQEVFGYEVYAKNKVLHERTEKGERPLRNYSKEMQWAWEVAIKTKVSLIPIEGGQWFAFVGNDADGWGSPQALLQFLDGGDFSQCGAAVGESAPEVICKSALVAIEKRKQPNAPPQVILTESADSSVTH